MELHSLLLEELIRVSIDTHEILRGSKRIDIILNESFNDLTGVLLLFDFLIEVEEDVWIVWQASIYIELESLYKATITFFSYFSGDFLLDSRFTVTMLD